MKTPMTITLDATTWYAIESALKFASKQEAALGQDRDFVRGLVPVSPPPSHKPNDQSHEHKQHDHR